MHSNMHTLQDSLAAYNCSSLQTNNSFDHGVAGSVIKVEGPEYHNAIYSQQNIRSHNRISNDRSNVWQTQAFTSQIPSYQDRDSLEIITPNGNRKSPMHNQNPSNLMSGLSLNSLNKLASPDKSKQHINSRNSQQILEQVNELVDLSK